MYVESNIDIVTIGAQVSTTLDLCNGGVCVNALHR